MAPLSFLKGDRSSQSPSTLPPAESPGRSRPSRLLGRKISLSARLGATSLQSPDDGESALEPPACGSTAGSVMEKQQEVSELGRSLFGRQRRGSDSVVKRPGWSFGRKTEEAVEEPTLVILSPSPAISDPPPASRRIAEDQNALSGDMDHQRPETPPERLNPPFPTALSPPRRPVASSPKVGPYTAEVSSVRPAHLQSLSALGPGLAAPFQRSGSPASSSDGREGYNGQEPRTAAWLARKPSTRSQRDTCRSPRGSAQHRSPSPTARRRPVSQSRIPSSSSNGDDEGDTVSSDAEEEPRKPNGQSHMPGYEVEVVCKANEDGAEEMRWEVIIRPSKNTTDTTTAFHPVLLTPSTSITQVPPAASSLNMTLALDQPYGKMVFISLPSDVQATPTRRRTVTPVDPSTPPRTFSPREIVSPMSSNTRRRGMYLGMNPSANKSPPASPSDLFTPKMRTVDQEKRFRAPGGAHLRGESPNPDAMEHLRGD